MALPLDSDGWTTLSKALRTERDWVLKDLDDICRRLIYVMAVEELIGAEKADRLVEVTSHLYDQYMAQAISVNMRNANGVPVNDS
jgi:hypothetical protein